MLVCVESVLMSFCVWESFMLFGGVTIIEYVLIWVIVLQIRSLALLMRSSSPYLSRADIAVTISNMKNFVTS